MERPWWPEGWKGGIRFRGLTSGREHSLVGEVPWCSSGSCTGETGYALMHRAGKRADCFR